MAKNQHTQSKYSFLNSGDELWMVHQKLGIILENKVVSKLKLENNVFFLPKMIFLNEKKKIVDS